MRDAGRRELEFIGELGKGGFGAVYLANLHGADRFVRRVAVKVMKPGLHMDPQLLARQRDEARLLGLLSHHAVVQVLDLSTVQGQPAVVMEYIEGVDGARLLDRLRTDGRAFPERAALEIIGAAASALDAVYNTASPDTGGPLRVIHRDIKPANLLITAHGGVKVLDFGVARADFDREGVTGSAFFGTAAYMAPEFWLQEPIGPAYDVYALGVTMLELLSAQHPARVVAERARYREWLQERLGSLRDVTPDTLRLLAGILAFDAADRPSAAEVHERCEALAGRSETESVGRLARRLVPAMLAARASQMSAIDLPSRAALLSPADGLLPTPPAPVAAVGPTSGETLDPARLGWTHTSPAPRPSTEGQTRDERVTPGSNDAPTVAMGRARGPTSPAGPRRPGPGVARELRPLLAGLVVVGALGSVAALLLGVVLWPRLTAAPEPTAPESPTASAAPSSDLAPPSAGEAALQAEGASVQAAVPPSTPPEPTVTSQAAPATSRGTSSVGRLVAPSPVPPDATTTSTSTASAVRAASPVAGAPPPSAASGSSASPTGGSPTGASPTGGSPTGGSPNGASASATPAADASRTTAPPDPSVAGTADPASPVRIKFASNPIGLGVQIDGHATCFTPCSASVAAGFHTLTLQGEAGMVAQRTMNVGAGQANDYMYDGTSKAWKANLR